MQTFGNTFREPCAILLHQGPCRHGIAKEHHMAKRPFGEQSCQKPCQIRIPCLTLGDCKKDKLRKGCHVLLIHDQGRALNACESLRVYGVGELHAGFQAVAEAPRLSCREADSQMCAQCLPALDKMAGEDRLQGHIPVRKNRDALCPAHPEGIWKGSLPEKGIAPA